MNKDPHGDSNSRYHVRSLYFDDIHNSGYYEKLNGVGKRKKYRIRIYNHSNSVIKLERKGKEGQYTQRSPNSFRKIYAIIYLPEHRLIDEL